MADADKKIVKVLKVGVGYNIVQYDDNTTARRTGTFAARNNNPGNLEDGSFARSMGAFDLSQVEIDRTGQQPPPSGNPPERFAIFPTYAMGREAKRKLLFEGSRYKDKTISVALSTYAPPSENNTQNYINTVVRALNPATPAITQDTLMNTLTEQQRIKFIDAVEAVESGRRGPAGSTPTAYTPGASTPFNPDAVIDSYVLKTYTQPLKQEFSRDTDVVKLADDVRGGNTFVSFDKKAYRDWLKTTNKLYSDSQLDGELALINLAAEANLTLQAEAKSNLAKIDNLIPAEAAFLIQRNLFELQPDLMRQQRSANAGSGNREVDYSHAWRAPGKLAITADITIPGASGFRIGQIFWVGRTYEHYKKFGAFQLFGLTEKITIERGWNTTIHSRFNAMPTGKVKNLKSE